MACEHGRPPIYDWTMLIRQAKSEISKPGGMGHGAAWRTWSSPRSNGCTGSTTTDCASRSATFHRRSSKGSTGLGRPRTIQSGSRNQVSGEPGAIRFAFLSWGACLVELQAAPIRASANVVRGRHASRIFAGRHVTGTLLVVGALGLRLLPAPAPFAAYALLGAYALSRRSRAILALLMTWLLTMVSPGLAASSAPMVGRYLVMTAAMLSIMLRGFRRSGRAGIDQRSDPMG